MWGRLSAPSFAAKAASEGRALRRVRSPVGFSNLSDGPHVQRGMWLGRRIHRRDAEAPRGRAAAAPAGETVGFSDLSDGPHVQREPGQTSGCRRPPRGCPSCEPMTSGRGRPQGVASIALNPSDARHVQRGGARLSRGWSSYAVDATRFSESEQRAHVKEVNEGLGPTKRRALRRFWGEAAGNSDPRCPTSSRWSRLHRR